MIVLASSVLACAAVLVALQFHNPNGNLTDAAAHKDWTRVERLARQALDAHPNDDSARRFLARAQLALAHTADAWLTMQGVDPAHLTAPDREWMRQSLTASGNTFLASLFGAGDGAPPVTASQNSTSEAAQEQDAAAVAAKLLAFDQESARSFVLLGVLNPHDPQGGEPALLASALLTAFQHVPVPHAAPGNWRKAPRVLAWALLGQGRHEEALKVLETEPATQRDREHAWLLSRGLLGAGQFDKARSALAASGDFGASDEFTFDPAAYIGAARCVACHAAQAAQQRTHHALSFSTAQQAATTELPGSPVADPVDNQVTHVLQSDNGQVAAVTTRHGERFSARVLYGFGSGRRGITFVGVDEAGSLRELRISKYAGGSWDRTTGHAPRPDTDRDYLGRALTWNDVHACLSCHTTELRSARDQVGPAAADRGIGCERCHGPGGNHVLAVQSRFPETAIALPAGARAARVTRLCGQCHKPSGTSTADPFDETGTARFQAATLPLSRCYNPAGTDLTCVTCHNPHADLKQSAEFYSDRCLNCHGAKATSPDKAQRSCQVATDRCVSCHMPKVASTTSRTRFTDHHIRVHRDTEAPTTTGH